MVTDNLNWIKFLKIIAEQEYLELEKRFFQLQRDRAAKVGPFYGRKRG